MKNKHKVMVEITDIVVYALSMEKLITQLKLVSLNMAIHLASRVKVKLKVTTFHINMFLLFMQVLMNLIKVLVSLKSSTITLWNYFSSPTPDPKPTP